MCPIFLYDIFRELTWQYTIWDMNLKRWVCLWCQLPATMTQIVGFLKVVRWTEEITGGFTQKSMGTGNPCWCTQIHIVWGGSESQKQWRLCHNSSLLPAGCQVQCQHLQWDAGYSGQAWILGSAHGRLYLSITLVSLWFEWPRLLGIVVKRESNQWLCNPNDVAVCHHDGQHEREPSDLSTQLLLSPY